MNLENTTGNEDILLAKQGDLADEVMAIIARLDTELSSALNRIKELEAGGDLRPLVGWRL